VNLGADELRRLGAAEIAAAVRADRVSEREVAEAHLAAGVASKQLNAFITLTPERIGRNPRRHEDDRLAGVPVAVKDLIEVRGTRTTYGSRLYAEHISTSTAPVVARLQRAGAFVIGKTNLHEFAWGLTSQNEHWGDVRNPLYPGHTPGGSSGGSAAAVAAGLAPLALGTDTGGSVRVPAAACGLVGFKPSRGLISMAGIRPLAPSFDTVGPIARSVADCWLAGELMAGRRLPRHPFRGLRAGVIEDLPHREALHHLGLRLATVALPEPTADLAICFMAECAFSHRDTFPRLASRYGRAAREKWSTALRVRASDYLAARLALRRWRAEVSRLGIDLLVSRVLGRPLPLQDVDEADIRTEFGRHARLANWLGWASLAYGDLMISAPDDATVLSVGLALEQAGLPLAEPIFDRV
jgi:aspartyl-tRNA(Asn)/glutamyl-tRNA(Gln) amidotransferase subunit A